MHSRSLARGWGRCVRGHRSHPRMQTGSASSIPICVSSHVCDLSHDRLWPDETQSRTSPTSGLRTSGLSAGNLPRTPGVKGTRAARGPTKENRGGRPGKKRIQHGSPCHPASSCLRPPARAALRHRDLCEKRKVHRITSSCLTLPRLRLGTAAQPNHFEERQKCGYPISERSWE